jgi:hypothetical protein
MIRRIVQTPCKTKQDLASAFRQTIICGGGVADLLFVKKAALLRLKK